MPELPDPKHRLHPFHIPPPSEGGGRGVGGTHKNSKGNTPTPTLPLRGGGSSPAYAELHITSNFTFLSGASHPEEYVLQARELGYRAIAITDVNSLAGIVRAHIAAKDAGMQCVVGCRVEVEGAEGQRDRGAEGQSEEEIDPLPLCPFAPLSLLLYPTDRASYGRLCQLLTLGKRRAPKGECRLTLHDVIAHHEGLLAAILPPRVLDQDFIEIVEGLARVFDDDRFSIASSCLYGEDDRTRLHQLIALSDHTGVPLVATNDVHYHVPERRALQDVLTCIRHTGTIHEAGFRLFPHAERYLKSPQEMARLFADHPQALARTVAIAERARGFNLDQLRYEYPHEVCPPGRTPMEYLIELTWQGAVERYQGQERRSDEATERRRASRLAASPKASAGDPRIPAKPQATIEQDSHNRQSSINNRHSIPIPQDVHSVLPLHVLTQILHEFEIIESLNYAPYFLTCYDIVKFARSQNILCQGRGAAANSAVCYCLGVTSVDPAQIDLLFERFVSRERNEPPDIDIDFEHERREEVIQYIYSKYGRDRAALTAEVITYRGRSAIRDVGKALGLSLDLVDRLAKSLDWWDNGVVNRERLREMGVNPDDHTVQHLCALATEILGFPRHLSQHVGGFVLTRGPLCESVPIENAAMADRTIIEWDKDDIDALGMLKVDVLGLGMLTCIAKGFRFIEGQRGEGAKGQREERIGEYFHTKQFQNEETAHSNFSRSDRMAEGNGAGSSDVSHHCNAATRRAVRPHDADAPCRCVNRFEHRRRSQPAGEERLPSLSQTGERFDGGTLDAVRIGDIHGPDHSGQPIPRDSGRIRSRIAGFDHESVVDLDPSSLAPFAPSPLPPCPLALHTIPPDDPLVYDMLCHADSVGVFQVESRAQMTMLPRLRPRCFYDLVIEVAIVRPGPIQGDMVHPYLRRRNGEEEVSYPNPQVERILKKTLGVPLFQEQAMQLAITAAGFTPGEADQLRRAIAAWRRKGNLIQQLGEKLINGMLERGYPREFAEKCFDQIKGFSEYGFPESHAASFAHLVYVSAWLKCHYPAAFAAALLNSQPMGFYAPAQIVRDAQEHGVEVRPVDVNYSEWDCTLEENAQTRKRANAQIGFTPRPVVAPGTVPPTKPHATLDNHHITKSPLHHFTKSDLSVSPCLSGCISDSPALRLGLRQVRGLREEDGRAIARAVQERGPFEIIEKLRSHSGVRLSALRKLAAADAFRSMGLDRQHALWMLRELRDEELPLFDRKPRPVVAPGTIPAKPQATPEHHQIATSPDHQISRSILPPIAPARQVIQDYSSVGLSLKAHPISFIREELDAKRVIRNVELKDEKKWPSGKPISVAGLTLVRQRPGTASGVVFITIEDETGIANLIIRPKIYEKFRKAARHATILLARGKVERQGEVVHVMVRSLEMLDDCLRDIVSRSRDFH